MDSRLFCAGVLAHVDAGKTTLCENILLKAGVIRQAGRVDDGNSFFDFSAMEKAHGITVHSKEASFRWKDMPIALIDTPGHADLCPEADRTVPVLDAAVFVVSASDIAKPHNRIRFRHLEEQGVPVIVFISKMDISPFAGEQLAEILEKEYSDKCIPFYNGCPDAEKSATLSEAFFDAYIEGTPPEKRDIADGILQRLYFPCIFGSGLKGDGVTELLNLLSELGKAASTAPAAEPCSAYVYKIDRDARGVRQSHVRITAGTLHIRDTIRYADFPEAPEKITEIRLLQGQKYGNVSEAKAGDVVVLTGLTKTRCGECIGEGARAAAAAPQPASLSYSLLPQQAAQPEKFAAALKILEEEEPSYGFAYPKQPGLPAYVHITGPVQEELLLDALKNRFQIPATLSSPTVEYAETIRDTVYGSGHYEPLRHYAEVRVKLTSLPRNSGIELESLCPEDVLDRHWQNAVLSYLKGTVIRGTLTGSPVTDIKISLLGGKTHIKHTEGGDMREAAIRAVRQGLMKAEKLLLEPYTSFVLFCRNACTGKVLTELEMAGCEVNKQYCAGDAETVIEGTGPLTGVDALMKQYAAEGQGRASLSYENTGYSACHNADAVILEKGYSPERDTEQPADSIFCHHGAGHAVKWDEADECMHTEPYRDGSGADRALPKRGGRLSEEELKNILRKQCLLGEEYALTERRRLEQKIAAATYTPKPVVYLIDGNNLLHGMKHDTGAEDINLLKETLLRALTNYASFAGAKITIVFDGHGIQNREYAGEKEILCELYSGPDSADVVLERLADEIGPDYTCKLVSSDAMVQVSALRAGILRMSAKEFTAELLSGLDRMHAEMEKRNKDTKSSIEERLSAK